MSSQHTEYEKYAKFTHVTNASLTLQSYFKKSLQRWSIYYFFIHNMKKGRFKKMQGWFIQSHSFYQKKIRVKSCALHLSVQCMVYLLYCSAVFFYASGINHPLEISLLNCYYFNTFNSVSILQESLGQRDLLSGSWKVMQYWYLFKLSTER